MTPFASGALSRGLTALLVSCVRLQGTEFNANKRASRIDRNHPYVKEAVKTILRRAELVGSGDDQFISNLKAELNERLDQWLAEAQKTAGAGCWATTKSGTASRSASCTGPAWSPGTTSPA